MSDKWCRFFLRGNCEKGEDCNFYHPNESELVEYNNKREDRRRERGFERNREHDFERTRGQDRGYDRGRGRGRGSYRNTGDRRGDNSHSENRRESRNEGFKDNRGRRNFNRKKNTECFEPSDEPMDMRLMLGNGKHDKYSYEIGNRDVILVQDLFCQEQDLDIYNKLVKEII